MNARTPSFAYPGILALWISSAVPAAARAECGKAHEVCLQDSDCCSNDCNTRGKRWSCRGNGKSKKGEASADGGAEPAPPKAAPATTGGTGSPATGEEPQADRTR